MMIGSELQSIEVTQRSTLMISQGNEASFASNAEKSNGFKQSRRRNRGAISISDSVGQASDFEKDLIPITIEGINRFTQNYEIQPYWHSYGSAV